MASDDEHKSVNLLNEMIEDLRDYLETLVLQHGVKGAVILLDKESSKVSFASAFPSNEKLVYANVGFASASSGQYDVYFEYENDEGDEKNEDDEEDEKNEDDEGDEKNVAEEERKNNNDDMIREMLEGCKWHKLTTTAIKLLKSRVSGMTCEELKQVNVELMEILSHVKQNLCQLQETEEKDDEN